MDHERMRRLHGGKGGVEKITHLITLTSRTEIARDTWLLRFEKPEGFAYRAGQHVRMSLLRPKTKDPAGNFRFWSFASAPFEPDLAFAIRMRPSPFKTDLMNLPVGRQVQVDMLKNPPHGAFALDDATTPAVFLAGGIGVVPAWSMIRQALHEGSPRPMTLFYSSRSREDAPFLDDLSALAARHPHFRFVPTLTGGPPPADWDGGRGRITLAMIRRHVLATTPSKYYVSGLKDMVRDLDQALRQAGVPADAIQSEEFGSFTAAHPRRRPLFGPVPLAGVAIAAAVMAVHLAPVLMLTNSRPLAWLKAHPLSLGVAAAILAVVLVKIVIVLMVRRSGRHVH